MRKWCWILTFLLVLGTSGISLAAEEVSSSSDSGTVEGVVYHEEGSFLADANVVLDDGAKQAKTGLDGRFSIEDVAPGEHYLMCSREG